MDVNVSMDVAVEPIQSLTRPFMQWGVFRKQPSRIGPWPCPFPLSAVRHSQPEPDGPAATPTSTPTPHFRINFAYVCKHIFKQIELI